MNDDLQKRLVATHNSIDPEMVTAEDLVRAIQGRYVLPMAKRLGYVREIDVGATPAANLAYNHYSAVCYIANLITLPEDKPDNRVIWRDGTPPPPAIKLEDLPFSEPINGVEQ